jgi:hypothetical protein
MNRRDFIRAAALSSAASIAAENMGASLEDQRTRVKTPYALETFNYSGVRLLPGMFAQQLERTRELYFDLSSDDILKGFRVQAGMPAPGRGLSGWCSETSAVVFGQWLSGMARMSAATGDSALREKALALADGWTQTTKSGVYGLDAYTFEKTVCGLVDLALYSSYSDGWTSLEHMTQWAASHLDRSRSPATPLDRDGRQPNGTNEWYTLCENLYRAYVATGNSLYKDFGDVWRYDSYWRKFERSSSPDGAKYLHSYSHANTFSSAAMAFAINGDRPYLESLKNGYEYLTQTQCYASGGYGPGEWSVPANGDLGNALDFRSDSAEIPCGSWGAFKLSKYLLQFTGEARYGDWIERLLYNGIGAALPVKPNGESFYYADYRVGMAQKEYYWDHWPCCSGTYIQAIADYHDLIYFRDRKGLFVNLFVPSEAIWQLDSQSVTIRQETEFPISDATAFRVRVERPVSFALRFRIPKWAQNSSAEVNGRAVTFSSRDKGWATIERIWSSGDEVVLKLPMALRLEAVDPQHPQRAAVLYGPILLAQDARYTLPLALEADDKLSKRLIRADKGLTFNATEAARHEQRTGSFTPFYEVPENRPYRVYFDLNQFRFL